MLKLFRKKIFSQTIIEYVSLILITSAAVGAMTTYISRILQVRMRHLNQEMNEAARGLQQI
jgi:hypothetical protein